MTIDELLSIAGLTANDEIPVWDAEATGEPTRKITAQQLAAAVVALASLVTGVKGNAEGAYRHGDVNITPANIGAASDSAAMQFRGWYPNGQSMLSLTPGYYQTSLNNLPSETFPGNINPYGMLCVDDTGYTHITYISVLGDFMSWASNSQKWYVVQHEGYVLVSSGGTGATTAYAARANLGCNDIGINEAQPAINLVNDDQIHNITISADCWVCVSLHVVANTNGSALVWRNNIPVINNESTNGACNYWANAQFPCSAGGLLQYRLNSNTSDSYISFLTV